MNPGDLLLINFPLTNLLSARQRPALILQHIRHSPKVHWFVITMITSRVEGTRLPGDVLLHDWKTAGLLHPSLVRLGKVATVEQELVKKALGSLTKPDLEAVRKAWKSLYWLTT